MRVWFNKAVSSVYDVLTLIRRDDTAGRFRLIHSSDIRQSSTTCAAHETHVEPSGLADEAYVDWCLAFCREHQIELLVPGRKAVAIAAAHDRFEAVGTKVLSCATSATLELLHDKSRFYAETQSFRAAAPVFRQFSSLTQFDIAYQQLRPRHQRLCVKPSCSVYGLGFAVIDEKRTSAQLLFDGVAGHIGFGDLVNGLAQLEKCKPMLLMEFLDGSEFSVDCVADQGRLICAVPRKKSQLARSGQLIDLREDILAATTELIGMYRLNGLCNVQYRYSSDKLRLLEVNPRMSGGIAMACAAGPNLPYMALCGFVDGFEGMDVPQVRGGIRVAQVPVAMELT